MGGGGQCALRPLKRQEPQSAGHVNHYAVDWLHPDAALGVDLLVRFPACFGYALFHLRHTAKTPVSAHSLPNHSHRPGTQLHSVVCLHSSEISLTRMKYMLLLRGFALLSKSKTKWALLAIIGTAVEKSTFWGGVSKESVIHVDPQALKELPLWQLIWFGWWLHYEWIGDFAALPVLLFSFQRHCCRSPLLWEIESSEGQRLRSE